MQFVFKLLISIAITVLRETKKFLLITDTLENLTRQKHPKL